MTDPFLELSTADRLFGLECVVETTIAAAFIAVANKLERLGFSHRIGEIQLGIGCENQWFVFWSTPDGLQYHSPDRY